MINEENSRYISDDIQRREKQWHEAEIPRDGGRVGDHIFVDYVCDDAIVLSTAVIKNDHIVPVLRLLIDRAAQIGEDLPEDLL